MKIGDCEYNINDTEVLSKFSGKGISGLVNIGNTCYLNTAIQLLSNVRLFTLYFIGTKDGNKFIFESDVNRSKKEVLFLKEWFKLMKAIWEDNCVIKPISFKKTIGAFYDSYGGFRQNDCQEALSKIIDLLHTGVSYKANIKHVILNKSKALTERDRIHIESIEAWKRMFHKEYSIPVSLFYGQFYQRVICDECNYVSKTFDPFNVLTLPIDDTCENIYDCFKKLSLSEDLDGDNMITCEKCKVKRSMKKKVTLWKAPNILVIAFERFKNIFNKISKRIDFPLQKLRLSSIAENNSDKMATYDLIGVGNHFGGIQGGHYTAYCKNQNNIWFEYDDSSVEEVSSPNLVVSNQAYILVYERNNIPLKTIIS